MHDAYYWVAIVGGALLILGYVWRAAERVKHHLSTELRSDVRADVREEVAAQVAPLVRELSPNSGTSLRDRVVRLDEWRVNVDKRLDRQDAQLSRIEKGR